MYNLSDTVAAVSSPPLGARLLVRITGPETIEKINFLFTPAVGLETEERKARLIPGRVAVDDELEIDALLYLFPAPNSYTGETVAEIHIYANQSVAGALLEKLLGKGLRMAGPGEFTARAYLNGKIDLAQAEAVNEIIVSSNKLQLAAAEKILGGRLAEATEKISSELMDCLSLIEAGLDFSSEDIELETNMGTSRRLSGIKGELERLLAGSINCESTLDLPAVGIAGAPNAGKSSLLNKLAGWERSIVSPQRKTTRDILTSELSLKHNRCVVFDCAGLIALPDNILDELAQQAAVKSLQSSSVVVFCVDVSKTNWDEDISIRGLIEPKALIPVATKSDLLSEKILAERIAELKKLFGGDFLTTSAKTEAGLESLRDTIDKKLIELAFGDGRRATQGREASLIALTTRHRQAVTESIENVGEAVNELKADNSEVAAMLLRAAYQSISGIEQQHVDEKILDRIFSRFCIGK
ncbi:MAG: 50S ribosome-binding GTPase [Phycisphaerae bacterium]|nr:50S ribosome-binding GTPase [Phycisphaerae bacterium]